MSHSTFTPFGRLPPELRQEIWAHSIWPRTIFVSADKDLQARSGQYRCVPRVSPAAILLVNCESRAVGLRFYQPSFHGQFQHPIYFYPEVDSLYMRRLDAMTAFYMATMEWQKLNADASSPTVSMPFCVALHFVVFGPRPVCDFSLLKGISEAGLVFPRLPWIIVTGYDEDPTELLERIQVPWERQLGRDQLLNGEIVPKSEFSPPKVLFLGFDDFELWMSEQFA